MLRLGSGASLRVRHESGLIAVSVLHSALVHFEIYSAALTQNSRLGCLNIFKGFALSNIDNSLVFAAVVQRAKVKLT